jgi:rhamnose utilization protein RhaD (predicted bifunctional aldolase and dehydrogenase)
MSDISADPEFQALRALSAGVERNRLRTQAAGGNTSIKRDGVMWIKASGRQFADALDDDDMVPVALEELRRRRGINARPPALLVLPGRGMVLHRSTTLSVDAMALRLADVVAPIPGESKLLRLSPEESSN